MNAIILAAGVGSRLRPLTDQKPKCMVHVNGRCIIDYQLEALLSHDCVDRVFVVAGFQATVLAEHLEARYGGTARICLIDNREYQTTNNLYSLYLSAKIVPDDGPVVLMNGDVVFDPSILSDLLKADGSALCVDIGAFNDESMKVSLDADGAFLHHIAKTIPEHESLGCSIDVYRFSKDDFDTLRDYVKEFVERDRKVNVWTEVAIDNLANQGRIAMAPIDVGGRPWYEIDNVEDLAAAEMTFGRRELPWDAVELAFVDLDGTVYCGTDPVPGAAEFVAELRKRVSHVFFLSNNSSRSHEEYRKRLSSFGIDAAESEIILSSDGLGAYLKAQDVRSAFVFGTAALRRVLSTYGVEHNETSPQAVVLGYDTELTYEKLATAALLIRQPTLPYYATHIDVVCPTPKGPIPDIGAMISLIESATGRRPNKVFGKPNPEMVGSVFERLEQERSKSIFFGDRVYTDRAMAEALGASFVGVLSGETDRAGYEPYEGIWVFPSVGHIFANGPDGV